MATMSIVDFVFLSVSLSFIYIAIGAMMFDFLAYKHRYSIVRRQEEQLAALLALFWPVTIPALLMLATSSFAKEFYKRIVGC